MTQRDDGAVYIGTVMADGSILATMLVSGDALRDWESAISEELGVRVEVSVSLSSDGKMRLFAVVKEPEEPTSAE